MADATVPDDLRDIVERLSTLATAQGLAKAAEQGCRAWFRNHGDDIPYTLSDVQMQFRSHGLVFRSALLSAPFIDTRLTLSIDGREIGYYRLITLLDGTPDDDYLVLDL